MQARKSRFPALIRLRCPEALPEAVEVAAAQRMTSMSEYARSALIERLKADGVDPAQFAQAS
jgi:hypothetical protein